MESDPPDAIAAHPGVRGTLRAKLPEILLEAASVLVAVLLAFAVDEWRDAREKRELAARARATVVAELRANRDELRGVFAANARNLEAQGRAVELFTAHPTATDAKVELAFMGAQLSTAAWDTTRATQAVQLLPFDWVVRVARVYELQSLYKSSQVEMLQRTRDAIAAYGASKSPGEIVGPLRSQLETFQMLGGQLARGYDEVLESGAAGR